MKTLQDEHQDFTGFSRKGLDALGVLQNPKNKGKNQKVKIWINCGKNYAICQ